LWCGRLGRAATNLDRRVGDMRAGRPHHKENLFPILMIGRVGGIQNSEFRIQNSISCV